MRTEKSIEKEQFIITKINDTYTVSIYTKDHLKEVFIKHKDDGFVCCGYDWCTLLIAFMYHNEQLSKLWYVFDYEPNEDKFTVSSKDGDALYLLMNEFGKIYNDVDFIEKLMQEMIIDKPVIRWECEELCVSKNRQV